MPHTLALPKFQMNKQYKKTTIESSEKCENCILK